MERLKKAQHKKSRISVSAEAYGEFNKKSDFKPPVHQKTHDQLVSIKSKLNKSFLFAHLEPKEQNIIALAMEIKKYSKGDMVIKQGDNGNELFVVDHGSLRCYKVFPDQKKETFLVQYSSGAVFGELALMYNAPRAASI